MKLSFQLADPAGNLTLLVTTPVPKEERRAVATRLLALKELKAEQVGFLVPPEGEGLVRLEMMGGEFCGNALRSVGLYFAVDRGLRREKKIPVEISGCDRPLTVQVNPLTGQVTAEMPLPRDIHPCTLFGEPAQAVVLEGIVHGIYQGTAEPTEEEVRAALISLCEEFQMPAAGVMFWQFRKQTMRPAVYVKETDSLYFESSCASGSTAVAAWSARNANRDGVQQLDIQQPGGVIQTAAYIRVGKLEKITIGGLVTLGPAYDITF